MRDDVRVDWTPYAEKLNQPFSRQSALTLALNRGAEFFAAGLFVVWLLAVAGEQHRARFRRRIATVTLGSAALVGLVYLSLPKIEVKLVSGVYAYSEMRMAQSAVQIALSDFDWRTTAGARAGLRKIISNPTNAAAYYLRNWDNYLVGGQIREEDSPGNYLLRETTNQLQLVTFDENGGENIVDTWDLPGRR